MKYALFVSCAKNIEFLLAEELRHLGLVAQEITPQGVFGTADLALIYQICLWSRLANRIQLILFSGQIYDDQSLYKLCKQFQWQTIFAVNKTIAIEFNGHSTHIRNTMFGAQVIKDAIVDHFRQLYNNRPAVDRKNPQILLHAHLKDNQITLSLDLVGYALHQRGYRKDSGPAPLKENLAAAILVQARWPELMQKQYALHDPCSGTGTLVIEAAMMAGNIAPGLLRHDQAFIHWLGHQPLLWEKARALALQQVKGIKLPMLGTDIDKKAITTAKTNAERAGILPLVHFEQLLIKDCRPQNEHGLLICNPPYGERLGEAGKLITLYQQLGRTLKAYYQGWQVAILTANSDLANAVDLAVTKDYTFFNGPLECKLYCFNLDKNIKSHGQNKPITLTAGAQILANRLRKNFNYLQKWVKRNQISCYRVYDYDLPEYAFAIDIYNDYAVLQEYVAPAYMDTEKTKQRSLEVISIAPQILNIKPAKIIIKQRQTQKGKAQYNKLATTKHNLIVQEGNAAFKINLYDYLDTGIFLDHRLLRLLFANLAEGTKFLNCFCYTATASVHAALAGAITTNVDLSNTYLNWAQENFKLNKLPVANHQFIATDCLKWLQQSRDSYDVIFLNPPSFSNSKKMAQPFDIQRDQEQLIINAMRLLKPNGKLYFATNLKKFKLSPLISSKYQTEDISNKILDLDFKRSKHHLSHNFIIRHK